MSYGLLIFILIFQSLSFAGPITSSGGNAVLCKNSQGEYSTAKVFDLYEGEALYGYKPQLSKDNYLVQARAFAKHLSDSANDSAYSQFFIDEMERVISEMKLLPNDVALTPVNDSDSVIKPKNCDVFQAAIYVTDKSVYFDSNVWSLLNDTHRAALLSHEVLYAFLRWVDGATTSKRTRQYVSFVFAGNKLQPLWKPTYIPGTMEEYCATISTSPSPYNAPPISLRTRLNNDNSWSISIENIGGMTSLGKTEITGVPSQDYSWPIQEHQNGVTTDGSGVTLNSVSVAMPLYEGLELGRIFLAKHHDQHALPYVLNGKNNTVYFSCQVVHYGLPWPIIF